MVMFICLPLILIFISLLLIGFQSIMHFSVPFLRMMATPSSCRLSSLPEYKTVSPVEVVVFPDPVHLASLMPKMCIPYRRISVVTCANLPVWYIVRTFQNPNLVLVLVLKTSIFVSVASKEWLSPLSFI